MRTVRPQAHKLLYRHEVRRRDGVGIIIFCGSRVRRRAPVFVTFVPYREDGTHPVDEPRPGEDVPVYTLDEMNPVHLELLLNAGTARDAIGIMKMLNATPRTLAAGGRV